MNTAATTRQGGAGVNHSPSADQHPWYQRLWRAIKAIFCCCYHVPERNVGPSLQGRAHSPTTDNVRVLRSPLHPNQLVNLSREANNNPSAADRASAEVAASAATRASDEVAAPAALSGQSQQSRTDALLSRIRTPIIAPLFSEVLNECEGYLIGLAANDYAAKDKFFSKLIPILKTQTPRDDPSLFWTHCDEFQQDIDTITRMLTDGTSPIEVCTQIQKVIGDLNRIIEELPNSSSPKHLYVKILMLRMKIEKITSGPNKQEINRILSEDVQSQLNKITLDLNGYDLFAHRWYYLLQSSQQLDPIDQVTWLMRANSTLESTRSNQIISEQVERLTKLYQEASGKIVNQAQQNEILQSPDRQVFIDEFNRISVSLANLFRCEPILL